MLRNKKMASLADKHDAEVKLGGTKPKKKKRKAEKSVKKPKRKKRK